MTALCLLRTELRSRSLYFYNHSLKQLVFGDQSAPKLLALSSFRTFIPKNGRSQLIYSFASLMKMLPKEIKDTSNLGSPFRGTEGMQIPPGKKIYFLSDFHLGAPDAESSLQREKRIVEFLERLKKDAYIIFIVGDMFDFWYEYRKVVPKGFVRLLGKIAELTDSGIMIHFFVGNHDMWMKNYFQKELNVPVHFGPKEFEFNGKKFLIGHGDGLGPKDRGYKMLKKIFRNPFCQWLFGILPPYIGMGLAHYSSQKSREADHGIEERFMGEEKEWLVVYSKKILNQKHFDFFIFGHRHLPIDLRLSDSSRYINLGEWMNFDTYAVFDGEQLELKSYTGKENKIYKNW